MPTRSITLRFDLSDLAHRQSIWTTHRLVNEKTRWLLEQLLLLRGEEVWTEDGILAKTLGHDGSTMNTHKLFVVTREQVRAALVCRLRRVKPNVTNPELVLDELQQLYSLVVPSFVESDGEGAGGDSGTLAKKWLKPLVDPASTAFETEQCQAVPPAWLQAKWRGEDWEELAGLWLNRVFRAFDEKRYADEGITSGYSKSSWFKAAKQDPKAPSWAELFEKTVQDAMGSPIGPLVKRLRELGLLDCLPDYHGFNDVFGDVGSLEMTKWDYLAFTRAIARLLSWESWNHRAKREHSQRCSAFFDAKTKLDAMAPFAGLLRSYEGSRTKILRATNQMATDETDFRLSGRQIRKWAALADSLRRANPNEDLRGIAGRFQTQHPKEYPDPYFTEWVLESAERSPLWQSDEGVQAVNLIAKANRLELKAQKSRERTAMTAPHPCLHPIWVQYEEPSGGNFQTLDLKYTAEGILLAQMALIQPDQDGFKEVIAEIPLRASAQFAVQSVVHADKKDWDKPGKTPVLTFIQAPDMRRVLDRAQTETWRGSMQSPDILLDRDLLSKIRDLEIAPPSDCLAASLKLVLDLEPKLVDGQGIAPSRSNGRWADAPKWAYHLQTSLSESSKHEESLSDGQRFLSVDLGVRDLASVALFEVRHGELTPDELGFCIPGKDRWKAVLVQGSIRTLSLDGELAKIDEATRMRRREAEDSLRLLKAMKNRRTKLLALALPQADAGSRKRSLDALGRHKATEEASRVQNGLDRYAKALDRLLADDDPPRARGDRSRGSKNATAASNVDPKHWDALHQAAGLTELPDLSKMPVAQEVLTAWDAAISDLIRVWRDRTRRRDPRTRHLHGKSLWAVEHLTEVRDFLKSWHRRGQTSGDINRPGPDFAKRLLDHINQIKEDRTKEGANFLVNTARGLVYDEETKRWESKFPPAHLTLFENLERYRFLTDRTPSENSQLMRWTHRELTRVVIEMAQLFGIGVLDTEAAFSSQFDGWAGTPGIRAQRFTQEELDSDWFRNKWAICSPAVTPVAGGPIPWKGGKFFITLDQGGRLIERDADHNAALSLARRFAGRSGEAVRMVCVPVKGGYVPVNLTTSKRLLGALRDTRDPKDKGYGWLVPDHATFCWQPCSQSQWEKLSGHKTKDQVPVDPGEDDDQDVIEAAQELADSESETLDGVKTGKRVVFFRDPSGVFFSPSRWVPGTEFWGRVRSEISKAL